MKKYLLMLLMMAFFLSITAENIIQVKPFKTTAGVSKQQWEEFHIEMTNDKDFTALQFDIYLPQGMEITDMELSKERFEGEEGKRGFEPNATCEFTPKTDVDGHYFVYVYHKDDTEMIKGNNGVIINFCYTTSTDMEAGVYPIVIKNMELSHDAFDYVRCAESTSFVIIASDDCPNPSLYGLEIIGVVPSFVVDEINNYNNLNSLDLTKATYIGKELNLTNPNATVYIADDINIVCNANVINEDVCENLHLTDGYSLFIPKPFTATSATYERSMANTWGTIILPYDVKSDDNTEYYIPTDVENDMLIIERIETLPANTPALVARTSGNKMQAYAHNVVVNTMAGDSSNGHITMYGSYENDTKITNPDAYYIKNNKFMLCNDYFFIDAFRAYFIVNGSAAKTLGISNTDATVLKPLLDDDVKIVSVYDETGKQIDGLKSGVNIIRLSNGQMIKIKR